MLPSPIIAILLFYSARMYVSTASIPSYGRQPSSLLPLYSRGASYEPYIKLVKSTFNPPGTIDGSGNFDYSFESENGIEQQGFGSTKIIGDTEVIVMRGSYKYVGPDGQIYVVDWIADENGFQPSAPHLPKEVPIPYPEIVDAVAAQLAFVAAEERFNGNQDVYPQISQAHYKTSGYEF